MHRPDALHIALTQVAALTAQVAALTAELAAVREAASAERAGLMTALEASTKERAALTAKINVLIKRIDKLIAEAKKAGRPVPTEGDPAAPAPKPAPEPAPAPAPAPSPGQASTLDDRPKPPTAPERGPKKTRKAAETTPQPEIPVSTETVRPDTCAHCNGSRLSNKETDELELKDYVPGYFRYRRVARVSCRCSDCGKVTTPPVPGMCLPKARYTAGFAAWIIYCKFALHLPLERQLRDLARMGHKTTNARLSNMVLRCLELVESVADVIFRQVMSGTHCHSDATGFPVLAPGSDSTHLGQIFCFSWGKLVALRYAADKKGVTFAMLAERFRGTMILDASSTHNAALATGRIIEAGCNAHGLRKFREAKDSDAILAAEGERWISSWFDEERRARERELSGQELLEWRTEHIQPLVDKFRTWLDAVHPTVLPRSPLAEATRYYRNHWTALTHFLKDPLVPLDNNFAERSLRGHAVGRNNWYFAGSDLAARLSAAARTLVVTAQLEGLDVLAYLTWLLERAAACREGGGLYADLTPAAYKKAQERVAG